MTRENNFTMKKNVIFKTGENFVLKADFYQPVLDGKRPAVIVVHGGGWTSRSGRMLEICESLASVGFVVMNITYRLSPEARYPKAVEDVTDAMKFMRDHADEYQVDVNRIGAWGYSAGSELILLAGLDPKNHFKALVAGGTPADFMAWPNSPIIPKYIGYGIQERPDLWKEASPVNRVESNSPPVFLYHGENDHIVELEQMQKMASALRQKNIEVKTYTVPFWGHIAVYLFSKKSIALGTQFLREKL